MVRIVVDAMGSDNAPGAQVQGAASALSAHESLEIALVGPKSVLLPLVSGMPDQRLTVIEAPDVIDPADEPVRAVKRKPDSSMMVALNMVARGEADAAVSAGNTGAMVAGGLFIVRRIEGVGRPALGTVIPTINGRGVLFMDMGASVDSRPEHVAQQAVMGAVYAREIMGRPCPRVSLLNVGTEPGKGNSLVREAYRLIEASAAEGDFEFAGNAEGRDLMAGGHDVIVADGFVGNIALKVIEGTAAAILGMLREEIGRRTIYQLGALAMRPAFGEVRGRMDYAEYGGAPLLGLRRTVIKCHGSSDARAVANGIRQAVHMIERDVPAVIGGRLAPGRDGKRHG